MKLVPHLSTLVLLALLAAPAAGQNESDALTLSEALAYARALNDPALARFDERAEALEHAAVADGQLPDPMVTGQIANVPVDSFSFSQDGMTQALRLGIRQEFPPGDTRRLMSNQRQRQAEVERARRSLSLRDIEREVALAWIEVVWREQATRILADNHKAVAEQIESLAARFASGRMHAQDLLRAELELSLLEDRQIEHRQQADIARAALSRYLGRHAFRSVPETLPTPATPAAAERLETRLAEHPAVQVEQQQIEAADVGIELAEQAYKPKFALEGGFGWRTDRADLASIGVTLSLPLFTDKRQDRRRAQAIGQRGAEALDRDLLLHDLRRQLHEELARWQRLEERLALYRQALAERARQTAEATLTTYANGQTDFAELIRALLAELQIDLKRTELEHARAQSWARLVWLTGEPS
ncbi:MAG: TolC family protein [Wenzhouxiangellaceae bacterium]|nr:TolC family protein [Wenzhouxiangellaceae bacterium]